MKASSIKTNGMDGRTVQIKVPYKNRFTILKDNKVYFPEIKDENKINYVTQNLDLNRPFLMLSDNDFLSAVALKFNNEIYVSVEEIKSVQTNVRIVDEYMLLNLLENLKKQRLGIMNIFKYEEIINKLKKNIINNDSEYIFDNAENIDEQFIITTFENWQTKIQLISIKYIFPGEYTLEIKDLIIDEYDLDHMNNMRQKVKVR